MNRASFEELGLTYKADSIYTNNEVDSSISGISTVQNISELRTGMENMLGVMSSIIVIFILASVVLGVVIIYNLGILSFSEKNYQFATLKVLGFKDKQIKEIFVKQNIWITIVAIAIGLPLGYVLVDYVYTHAIGDTFDFSVVVNLVSYLYAVIGTTVVSFVVNRFLARKVKNIDMVTSLKGNE